MKCTANAEAIVAETDRPAISIGYQREQTSKRWIIVFYNRAGLSTDEFTELERFVNRYFMHEQHRKNQLRGINVRDALIEIVERQREAQREKERADGGKERVAGNQTVARETDEIEIHPNGQASQRLARSGRTNNEQSIDEQGYKFPKAPDKQGP